MDCAIEMGGQTKRLGQPRHHHLLHLGGDGGALPNHALGGYRIAKLLCQHGGGGGISGKIGKKARVLPMGHAGRHDPFEIGKYL